MPRKKAAKKTEDAPKKRPAAPAAKKKAAPEAKPAVKSAPKKVKAAKPEAKPAIKPAVKPAVKRPAAKKKAELPIPPIPPKIQPMPGVQPVSAPKPQAAAKPHAAPKPHTVKKPEIRPAPPAHEKPSAAEQPAPPKAMKNIEAQFPVAVKDLAVKMQVKANELIKAFIEKNIFVTINQQLSWEAASEIAERFGVKLAKAPTPEEQIIQDHHEEDRTNLLPRIPVVTLMGHVDHGKTSLLDAIRQSNVTEREAGGITQHIGAYRVTSSKGEITFLDTPGHEAFSAMRARGATATDIVILVVAADDGIMPQTKEAIDHARAAGAPIVAAINKIDKQNADVERVKKQLSQLGLQPEDWGGKTITVGVSAKTKQGIDALLEMVLLEAEMLELKANITKPANGVVIEGRLSRGKGAVATVLVKNGTLRAGDTIIIGSHYANIRAMIDERGHKLTEAGPSVPVEILGLSGVPLAGEKFYVVEDEQKAKEIYQRKQLQLRQSRAAPLKKITLEDIYTQIKQGKIKELNIILKADVQGSLEALRENLLKLSTDEVKMNIIHADIGLINDADVILASASNAIVLGFNAAVSPKAEERRRKEGIDVRTYRVIYDLMNDMKAAMEGLLEPKVEKVLTGRASVKQVFKVSKTGVVAGCYIQKGIITRKDECSLIRDGKEIYNGRVSSLKRFKDDAREVKEGFECGITLSNFGDYKAGDLIEAYTIKKTARTL